MNKDKLIEFKNLWTSDVTKYVLLRTGHGPDGQQRFMIFNMETRMALVIEDEEVSREVKRRMHQAGVPVVDRAP